MILVHVLCAHTMLREKSKANTINSFATIVYWRFGGGLPTWTMSKKLVCMEIMKYKNTQYQGLVL